MADYSGKRAQGLAELAVLFALITAVIFAMQFYIRRGLQGRYKTVVDAVGSLSYTDDNGLAHTALRQYEPYYAASEFTSTKNSEIAYSQTGGVIASNIALDTSSRRGWQVIDVKDQEGLDADWDK